MKNLSVTLALEEFGSWNNIRVYEHELYQRLKNETTRSSYYLQGDVKEEDDLFNETDYWGVLPVITEEQKTNWPDHFPQDREYRDFMVVSASYNWAGEWEYYLRFGSESDDEREWNMYDYYDTLDEEDKDVRREDDRELDAQWAMLEPRYLRRRRRERSEDAHKRQEKKPTRCYCTRRRQIYYGMPLIEEAINDYYWVESGRSRPNNIGRQMKKLRRQIYLTNEELRWFSDSRTERRLARLRCQLTRLEMKKAEMRENGKQNKFHRYFSRRINSLTALIEEADEYLIGCDP